ncbi:hypothetical protein ACHQM5_009440 [Ranunculus cassubicifolius]
MAEKLAPEKRHSFVHGVKGHFFFTNSLFWDQTLEEVNIYINLPPNVPTKLFYCKIQSKHVELGIKGNPPYLNHDLTCPVKIDSSFWTLEDDIIHITLQKREKGQMWASRYRVRNPGFDFSQVDFSGNCPDPRTFMGGIQND